MLAVRVNNFVLHSRIAQKLVWNVYYGRSLRDRQPIPLSAAAQNYVKEFRRARIVAIAGFEGVADCLNDEYFRVVDGEKPLAANRLMIKQDLGDRAAATGQEAYYLSFFDSGLAPLSLSPEVSSIVYNYYGKQPYFRNPPVLHCLRHEEGPDLDVSAKHHVDGFRQISYMLLLNDIRRTTHTCSTRSARIATSTSS